MLNSICFKKFCHPDQMAKMQKSVEELQKHNSSFQRVFEKKKSELDSSNKTHDTKGRSIERLLSEIIPKFKIQNNFVVRDKIYSEITRSTVEFLIIKS